MVSDIKCVAEEILVKQLTSLIVQGKVIDKKIKKDLFGGLEKYFLLIKFKNREIEIPVEERDIVKAKIGDPFYFNPLVPERDSCERCLLLCIVGGITAGILLAFFLIKYFPDRVGAILTIVAGGIVGGIAWAVYSCHERNKFLDDFEREIKFFEADKKNDNSK